MFVSTNLHKNIVHGMPLCKHEELDKSSNSTMTRIVVQCIDTLNNT